MTRTSGSGNSHTLDLLRGLSALGVVALHLDKFTVPNGYSIPLHDIGELGVQMFFVLSGYFIGTSVLAPRAFDTTDYSVNRVLRIVPNYMVALMIALVVCVIVPARTVDGPGDVLTHVFFVHGWFIDYRVSLSPVLWTLSVEWMFYLFMLVAARSIRHRRFGWWTAFGMVALAFVYRIVLWSQLRGDNGLLNFGYKQLPGTLDLFGLGLLAALLLRQESVRRWAARPRVKRVGVVVAGAAMLVALALYGSSSGVAYYEHREMYIFFPLVFAVAAAALIVFFQQFEGRLGPALSRSRLAFVGVISYSIYLYHTLVISTFDHALDRLDVHNWVFIPMVLVAIFLVSVVGYQFVERPFMEGRGRVRRWMHARLTAPDPQPIEPAPTGNSST